MQQPRSEAARTAATQPIHGKAIPTNGGTIGFAASSPEQVKAWHDAGVAAGGKSVEEPPGVREALPASSISPICVILTTTRFAPCIAWVDSLTRPASGPSAD